MSIRSLLLQHGYYFLAGYVFGVTAGLPVPADPLLLVMGAMTQEHRYALSRSLLAASAAALLADCLWYEVGRRRGRPVLRWLCRLSIEPDTCVRTTEVAFRKRGAGALLLAKFVPGMSIVSMPLAGISRMPRSRFLLADAAGCVFWALTWLLAGRVFYRQVGILIQWLGLLGRRAGLTILVLAAAWIG